MTVQDPSIIEERLNGALERISQLQEAVSELTVNSKQQEELITELLNTWGGSPSSYYPSEAPKAREEGQASGLYAARTLEKERLNQELTELYKRFEKVQGFAIGEYLDETRVYVLLQMDLYDGMLIERLTTAEAVLEDNFPAFSLMIHHVPVGDIDLASYLGERGTLIWQRDSE